MNTKIHLFEDELFKEQFIYEYQQQDGWCDRHEKWIHWLLDTQTTFRGQEVAREGRKDWPLQLLEKERDFLIAKYRDSDSYLKEVVSRWASEGLEAEDLKDFLSSVRGQWLSWLEWKEIVANELFVSEKSNKDSFYKRLDSAIQDWKVYIPDREGRHVGKMQHLCAATKYDVSDENKDEKQIFKTLGMYQFLESFTSDEMSDMFESCPCPSGPRSRVEEAGAWLLEKIQTSKNPLPESVVDWKCCAVFSGFRSSSQPQWFHTAIMKESESGDEFYEKPVDIYYFQPPEKDILLGLHISDGEYDDHGGVYGIEISMEVHIGHSKVLEQHLKNREDEINTEIRAVVNGMNQQWAANNDSKWAPQLRDASVHMKSFKEALNPSLFQALQREFLKEYMASHLTPESEEERAENSVPNKKIRL